MATERRRRIGEMLIDSGVINKKQLMSALQWQNQLREQGEVALLGSVLIELKILTSNQLISFIQLNKINVPLGEYLVINRKITKDQLRKVLEIQKVNPQKKLGTLLVEDLKLISEETLLKTIAKQNNIPRIKPDMSEVDPELFFTFSQKTLMENRFIPYKKYQGEPSTVVYQCIISEFDIKNMQKIKNYMAREITSSLAACGDKTTRTFNVEFAFASLNEILEFIPHVYDNKDAVSLSQKVVVESSAATDVLTVGTKYYSSNHNMNIFMQLLMKALDSGASDIHIEPSKHNLRIRFRIDGILIEQPGLPKTLNAAFVRGLKNFFRFKDSHVPNIIVDDRKRVYYEDKDIEADLRIAVIPTVYGDKMVLRILIQAEVVPTFEKLGMFKNLIEKYRIVCSMSSGIVIVTGPTGSGKSTTLYSTLDYLNREDISILTLEDPPEYLIDGVSQVRVGSDDSRETSYSRGIKAALRQDPDIIMFGEMRDHESASVALTAGLTGHLLFTTLHTNDAASAIARLFDMGIRPFLLSSTLVSILGQRLVRVVCPGCKVEYMPGWEELEFFTLFIHDVETDIKNGKIRFSRGSGCRQCNNTGFKGMIAIHELLCMNDEIKRAVLQGAVSKEAENIARRYGMTSLVEDGFLKAVEGITTIEEVLRVSKNLENPKNKRTVDEIRYLLEGNMQRQDILSAMFSYGFEPDGFGRTVSSA
ncbi:MAG: Flp pilus assembly complex ATPase component TadA [Nitrospirae bacterium]|nr:Flp pilus assembly complex ATPase component TadA [Nitrospirota bacterium]